MWWENLLRGIWNGMTAWIVLIAHVFGAWKHYPVYDTARAGNWYAFGFLIGAGSPLLGTLGQRPAPRAHSARGHDEAAGQVGPATVTEA